MSLENCMQETKQTNMDQLVELEKNRKEEECLKSGNVNTAEFTVLGTSNYVHDGDIPRRIAGNTTTFISSWSPDVQEAAGIHSTLEIGIYKAALKRIAKQLHSEKMHRQSEAIRLLRHMVSTNNQLPIDTIVKVGVVPRCVEFLKNKLNGYLQHEAAGVLLCIAAAGEKPANIVVEAGAVDPLVDMLQSIYWINVEVAALTLGYIATNGPSFHYVGNSKSIVPSLVALLKFSTSAQSLRIVAWALTKFCNHYGDLWPPEDFKLCIPTLVKLVKTTDEELIYEACWALKFLSDASGQLCDKVVEQVITSKVAPKLLELMSCGNSRFIYPCLKAMMNFVSCSELQTLHFIDSGVLTCLAKLLKSAESNIVWCSAWTVRNIAVTGASEVSKITRAGVVPLLVDVLQTENLDAAAHALYALKCIASENADSLKHVYEANAIPALCNMLKCKDADVVFYALDAIVALLQSAREFGHVENVALAFEECKGLESIEELLNHHENLRYFSKQLTS